MKQLTLGKLINKLEKYEEELVLELSVKKAELDLTHDSYRGYYEDVAFGYKEKQSAFDSSKVTVGEFLNYLKTEVVNSKITGWRGGDEKIYYHTLCWLANEGEAEGNKIVDVQKYNGKVFILVINDFYKE